jgi:hypothetical protein
MVLAQIGPLTTVLETVGAASVVFDTVFSYSLVK